MSARQSSDDDASAGRSSGAWLAALERLRRNDKFCDVRWSTSQGRAEHAHKFMIYSRTSAPFQATLRQLEDASSDPGASVTDLASVDATVLGCALDHVYTASQDTEGHAILLECLPKRSEQDKFHSAQDRLRHDLLYAWRCSLYTDSAIRIQDDSQHRLFPAHRALLAVRSAYFESILLDDFSDSNATVFTLPAPLFNVNSLNATLHFMYSGLLPELDLESACLVLRCATFLLMDDLIRAVENVLLRHVKPETAGSIYAVATSLDVCSSQLESASAQILRTKFAQSWPCRAVAQLSSDQQKKLVLAVCAQVSPATVTSCTLSVLQCQRRLQSSPSSAWRHKIEAMLEAVEDCVCDVLSRQLRAVTTSMQFQNALDGVGFQSDVVEAVLALVLRRLSDKTALGAFLSIKLDILGLEERALSIQARQAAEDALTVAQNFVQSRWLSLRESGAFKIWDKDSLEVVAQAIGVSVEEIDQRGPMRPHAVRPGHPPSPPNETKKTDILAPAQSRTPTSVNNGRTPIGARARSSTAAAPRQALTRSPNAPLAPRDVNSTPSTPSQESGTTLLTDLSCLVAMADGRRVSATVKYLGKVDGKDGEWVGIDVESSSSSYEAGAGACEIRDDRRVPTRSQMFVRPTQIVCVLEPVSSESGFSSNQLLVELIASPAVRRLASVLQHGISALVANLGQPPVNRLDHSIGAFLCVRRLGASLDEQVAALLHDISHTALSHTIDAAFGRVVHETDKHIYLDSTTLREIVERHGLGQNVFNEDEFGLTERSAPDLCADRLDYALRDALAFGVLSREQVSFIVEHVTASQGEIVMDDVDAARLLARSYLECDKLAWSNPYHAALYHFAAAAIREAHDSGELPYDALWTAESCGQFWANIASSSNPLVRQLAGLVDARMRVAEVTTVPVEELDPACTVISIKLKARVIDPKVIDKSSGRLERLSILDNCHSKDMARYKASKAATKTFLIEHRHLKVGQE
ncbi:hypothetical protein ACM66B_003553 [Microbotryomycetes sp. NB124-2]